MIRLLGLIPFVMLVFAAPFVNTVEPRILHLPFFLAWITIWTILTPVVMLIMYKGDKRRRERS
ncbi:MAG: DUF3311 domain-containing protein [Rubrobacteraceae bacterium]